MKLVDIEKLLHWAYRDELPKRSAEAFAAWDTVSSYGERGGMDIDDQNGIVGRLPAILGECHPDARVIGEAVRELEDTYIDWRRSRVSLCANMVGLVTRAPSSVIAGMRVQVLVTMHASMGTRPSLDHDMPRPHRTPSRGPSGYKIVGESEGKNRYKLGSYCPLVWSTDPHSIVLDRAEYSAWHSGINKLASMLDRKLRDYTALPTLAPAEPWNEITPMRKVWTNLQSKFHAA